MKVSYRGCRIRCLYTWDADVALPGAGRDQSACIHRSTLRVGVESLVLQCQRRNSSECTDVS